MPVYQREAVWELQELMRVGGLLPTRRETAQQAVPYLERLRCFHAVGTGEPLTGLGRVMRIILQGGEWEQL